MIIMTDSLRNQRWLPEEVALEAGKEKFTKQMGAGRWALCVLQSEENPV